VPVIFTVVHMGSFRPSTVELIVPRALLVGKKSYFCVAPESLRERNGSFN
jgi:hypothetical protein